MNEAFVNVKVDREERPDVDRMYMTYLQVGHLARRRLRELTRKGVAGRRRMAYVYLLAFCLDSCERLISTVLTPNLEPFFAGTHSPLSFNDKGSFLADGASHRNVLPSRPLPCPPRPHPRAMGRRSRAVRNNGKEGHRISAGDVVVLECCPSFPLTLRSIRCADTHAT